MIENSGIENLRNSMQMMPTVFLIHGESSNMLLVSCLISFTPISRSQVFWKGDLMTDGSNVIFGMDQEILFLIVSRQLFGIYVKSSLTIPFFKLITFLKKMYGPQFYSEKITKVVFFFLL